MAFIFPIGLGGGFYAPARANSSLRSLPITCRDKKTSQHTKSSHKKKCCGIEDSISLTYDSNVSNRNTRRKASLKDSGLAPKIGYDRDEFPYATTMEGGKGACRKLCTINREQESWRVFGGIYKVNSPLNIMLRQQRN